jgi:uncharacterized membrane protein
MGLVVLTLFYFLFPVLIIYLDKKSRFVNRLGPVIICYGAGLMIGNIGILPEGIQLFKEQLSFGVVLIGLPLILFSLDLRRWLKVARQTLLSLVLGLISVVIMVFIGFYLYRDAIPETWKVAGVLVGYYSGGSPNAAAISAALDMDPTIWALTYIYDLGVGALTLLFLMTVAQRFFLLFMRPYQAYRITDSGNPEESYREKFESYDGIFKRGILLPLLAALGLSFLIVGISAGISFLISGEMNLSIAVISLTSLGIAASFIPRVNGIEKNFQGGMYLVLVFCLVFASIADIRMFTFESLPILYYILLTVPGALLLHGLLSWIFRVDVDNFLIISVSLSMSPPFVPAVASALKNRDIIMPGMIIGMIGYAAGTYIGILLGHLIKGFG